MKRELEIGDRQIIRIENDIVSIPSSVEIWMTQHEISDLLGCFIAKINSNIRAILKTGVLDESMVYRWHRYENGGGMELYGLEMIVALAFRIRSHNSDLFREWMIRKAVSGITTRQIFISGNWNGCDILPN